MNVRSRNICAVINHNTSRGLQTQPINVFKNVFGIWYSVSLYIYAWQSLGHTLLPNRPEFYWRWDLLCQLKLYKNSPYLSSGLYTYTIKSTRLDYSEYHTACSLQPMQKSIGLNQHCDSFHCISKSAFIGYQNNDLWIWSQSRKII